MLKMVRWVKRHDLTVSFGNVVGPYVGKPYAFLFPSVELAKSFELLAKSTEISDTGEKIPAAIPETWRKYRVKTDA